MMIVGLALGTLERGGWIARCVVPSLLRTLNVGGGNVETLGAVVRLLFAVLWLGWWSAVGALRCRAEDTQLKKLFGREWDEYAGRVRWWYVPGVV